ncbi:MAG: hypothetical protein NC483_04300 [Ruminococcus sp.]|nr:hypothetical protein [Ruminococcus sp.]
MEFWLSFLPIIIYILLIIILIIGIILGIKTIITINKVEKVVDDVNEKVASLNGLFQIIDFTSDKIATLTDRVVDGVSRIASKIFMKKKVKKGKDEKDE